MHQRWFGLLAASVFIFSATQTRAVVLYRTPTRNTSAPSSMLYNSGWQWEGKWGGFLGTPIAPNYFITAGHVGGVRIMCRWPTNEWGWTAGHSCPRPPR